MPRLYFKKYILVVAVIGLLIFLHSIKVLSPLEILTSNTLKSLSKNFYSISSDLRASYSERINKKDLITEIKELKNQINQLIVKNAKFNTLEEENQLLRQNLKFLAKNDYNYVMANVISRGELTNITQNNQTIIIDKGLKDGLFQGLAVISPAISGSADQGIIIGKIISAKENISEVCLITNPNCDLAVSLFNQDKTSGIAHGELGLTVKMEFIPQNESIGLDDIVVTSGMERNVPRGLVVGKIVEVIKESNELWQKAIIEPLINLDNLVIAVVLLP